MTKFKELFGKLNLELDFNKASIENVITELKSYLNSKHGVKFE